MFRGLLLVLVAGVMNASFSMPMKKTSRWAWENTWLVWTLFALLILPTISAIVFIPNILVVYREAGLLLVLRVALLGFGWGIAQVLFGLAIDSVGVAVSFSVVLGLSAATGGLTLLFRLHPEQVFEAAGRGLFIGTALVLVGLVFCAIAGQRREIDLQKSTSPKSISFGTGLLLAILSGVLAAFMNYGVAFGTPLLNSAISHGASGAMAMNAIWWPLLAAGSIPNVVYCVFLLNRNGTGRRFLASKVGAYWLLALLMGVLWLGSTLLYGAASSKFGELGPALGWPIFMSVIVLSANAFGAASGEWRNAGKNALRLQAGGIAFLVLAVVVLSRTGF